MAGNKQFTVYTKFAVKNGLTGPMLSIAKGADKAAARVEKMKVAAGKVSKGVAVAGKGVLALAGAATAATVAVGGLVLKTSSAADDIQNTSNALGISAKALQEYRYAGILAGLQTEDMDAALRKLTVNLGKDSQDVEDALYQIGLSADDLKAAGPDKSLEVIANGFQKLTDPTKKAAVATALFGKSSVRMVNMLSGGEASIKGLREEAEKTGYVMDDLALQQAGDLDDQLDRLKATATGLGNRLALKVIPFATKLGKSFTESLMPGGKVSNLLDKLGDFGGNVMSGIGPALGQIMDFLPKIIDFASGLWTAIQPVVKPLLEAFTPLLSIIEKLMPLVTSLASAAGAILGPIAEIIKWILQGIDQILGKHEWTQAETDRRAALVSSSGGATAMRFAPVSPATTSLSTSSSTTSTSKVELTIPPGVAAKQTGKAPGLTLNTGPSMGRSGAGFGR